jgi:GNAT superfamily N-acetyltransferase
MNRGWQGAGLRHVYVDPDHTRQGIATRLLSHVEADFRDRTSARQITAEVVLPAEPFYLANGYEIVNH